MGYGQEVQKPQVVQSSRLRFTSYKRALKELRMQLCAHFNKRALESAVPLGAGPVASSGKCTTLSLPSVFLGCGPLSPTSDGWNTYLN